jgi:NADPH:quinone reductase-like Zn-dependent oxidoreductase
MRRVCFDTHGEPEKVLRLDEIPSPKPGRGQVLLKMVCAPVHPADLALIRGVYVRPDSYPAVAGLEGLGKVTALGPGVKSMRVGGRYLVSAHRGTWAEEMVVPAESLIPAPKDVPDDMACQLVINPLTAYGLLDMVKRPGAVLQTAAGSAVGRLVDQIGRRQGRKIINVVRSEKTARDLKKNGAVHVVVSSTKNWQAKVKRAAGKTPIVAAFDPIAGQEALEPLGLLSSGGELILYGGLSGKPVPIGAMGIAGKDLAVRGFWLSPWMQNTPKTKRNAAFKSLAAMIARGDLKIPVAGVYEIRDFKKAIQAAETPGRLGKILLKMS